MPPTVVPKADRPVMASWRNYAANCGALPRVLALAIAVLFLDAIPASAQQLSAHQARATALAASAPVTPENFPRAESDLYFGNIVKDGGFGKFRHRREPTTVENQSVIRLNRDTLYSAAVFDLDAGPVRITLPDAGKRFMSMQVISEDRFSLRLVNDRFGSKRCFYTVKNLPKRGGIAA